MLKKFTLLLLLLILALPLPALAQADLSLAALSVELWPEFDRPTVLVMYQMSLAPGVSLPAQVRVRIPVNAGAPNAVAVCQAAGNCFNTQYEQRSEGAWSVLTIQATLPDIRVEYYDPGLSKDGPTRRYTYTWPGDYAVEAMKVSVQQPTSAQNLHLKPAMFNLSTGENGLSYYDLEAGALAAGQTFSIDLDYQKSDDKLTYNNLPVAPSNPLNSPESGRSSLTSLLPVGLGLLGLLLMVGGGLWYWRSGRQPVPAQKGRRRHRPTAQTETVEAAENVVYCHQCGRRAAPGDRFCRDCGATLRVAE